jgi:acetylornithine deacetylase
MPGQDVDAVLERVRRCAQENDLELDLLYTGKPLYTDPNSELVRAVLDVAGDSAAHTVSYGTDGMVIGQHMPVVVIGPGDIAQAHTADEWIEIDQLEKGVELNRKLIQRFCC